MSFLDKFSGFVERLAMVSTYSMASSSVQMAMDAADSQPLGVSMCSVDDAHENVHECYSVDLESTGSQY